MEIASLKSTIKRAKDGTYEFVMNEETTDRDGEIIEVDGWELKDYKDNSILLFGHRHDIPGIGVVGRVAKETNDGKRQLVAKGVRFATQGIYDLADVVHGLVDDDIIKATSVGFQALEREYPTETGKGTGKDKAPRVRTKKASLYELSIVNVGAHPAALRIKSAVDKAAMDYKDKDMAEIEEKLFLDAEPKGSVETIVNESIIKKMDLLCLKIEALEEMIKSSKPRRLYDGLFAGDPGVDPKSHAQKEDDVIASLPKQNNTNVYGELNQ